MFTLNCRRCSLPLKLMCFVLNSKSCTLCPLSLTIAVYFYSSLSLYVFVFFI
ncbi:hypothetical protein Hanom_Chr03g00242711 [Helianthus anomalus]